MSVYTASGFQSYLFQDLDVSQFHSLSLHITGSFNGTLTFLASNILGADQALLLQNVSDGDLASSVASQGGLFRGPIDYHYLSASFSSWTSGTATADLELYTTPFAPVAASYLAFKQGSTPSAASADQQGLVQRVSIYGSSGLGGNGDTSMKMLSDGTVVTVGDGTSSVAVAAGKNTDTVIKGVPGRLYSILVTAPGTNAMQIFDNASVGSGKIIGLVPANSPANGVSLTPRMPAALGITVKGNAANPAVTISYS
jgi:hypothetical protein